MLAAAAPRVASSPAQAPAPAPLAPPAPLRPDWTPVGDRRRPRLLLAAARHGLALYRRDRDLPRLLSVTDAFHAPLDALTEAEARTETARRIGLATYSFTRHVDLLIALLAETRLQAQKERARTLADAGPRIGPKIRVSVQA